MVISDFDGHRVWLSFFRLVDVNGQHVKRMEGVLSVRGMQFLLRNVTAALDEVGGDVLAAANLTGKVVEGDLDNVITVESPEPVHVDDEESSP